MSNSEDGKNATISDKDLQKSLQRFNFAELIFKKIHNEKQKTIFEKSITHGTG